jgi:hypothetical protein
MKKESKKINLENAATIFTALVKENAARRKGNENKNNSNLENKWIDLMYE